MNRRTRTWRRQF